MKHSELGLHRFVVAVCLLAFLRVSCAQNVVTYYHTDITGSPIAATNSSGAVVWREEFAPYGEKALQEVASESNRLWFTGHHHDDQTGLTYAGARHYDPMLGRFMAVDPMGTDPANQFSFSRYVYANNNPYGYVDPDGEYALAAGAVLLAFGALYIGGCQASGSCPKFGQTLWEAINSDANPLRFRGRMSMGPGDNGQSNSAGGGSGLSKAGAASPPGDPNDPGDDDKDEAKPRRVTNPKHHQNSASPEPRNVDQLYRNSVRDESGVRWAKDDKGVLHRFSEPSNGEVHWNGSTGGSRPIKLNVVPKEIKRHFGIKG